jgi:hypothetical protein
VTSYLKIRFFQIIENTLEQNIDKQSGPSVPSPQIVGVLQVSPPRNESRLLDGSLPAKNCSRWLSQATGDAPLGGKESSSSRNGFEEPPHRRKIAALSAKDCGGHAAWMSSIVKDTPQSPPPLQNIAGSQSLSTRLARGESSSNKIP